MRRRRLIAAALGVAAVLPMVLGAAAVPEAHPAGFCLPILFTCPDPKPTPTPTPAPGGATPTTPGSPSAPGAPAPGTSSPTGPATAPTAPAPGPDAQPAPMDETAPVFTKTPSAMGSSGLSFTGLSSIGFVTVPTVDGTGMRVLKISADSITITGFSLTVRPPGGPGLVTNADTMSLTGHVTVYIGSLTAATADGRQLTIGADTPPPLDDVSPGLLRVTMGLVGTIADSIHYTNTDQRIVE